MRVTKLTSLVSHELTANIRGLHSNFVECESFFESNSPDILALCEANLDDSVDYGNFSVRGYLPLILYYPYAWPCIWVIKEFLLHVENTADSYLCFQPALLQSVPYFFFLYRTPSSSLCTDFDATSYNIDEVLSINPYANVCLNVHHEDWLAYSSGTDR